MPYVINLTVKKSIDSDWRQLQPAGDGWNVVKNKNGDAQDFNQGAGGDYIFIFYQIGVSGKGIAAVRFIKGEGAKAPDGWTKEDIDLNAGAGGEYIYLCYLRNSESEYIREFVSGSGKSAGSAFDDFDSSAVVLRQELNKGAKGKYIYLGYRYNN